MASGESVEKMKIVVDSLRANPDVVVVGGIERNYLHSGEWPYPHGYFSRTLDIFTHPVKPIYDSEELNDFMFGLVPELAPTMSDRFYGGLRKQHGGLFTKREDLGLGKLYFDEVIGTVAMSATVELVQGLSVVESGILSPGWETKKVEDLKQRTWLRVFPDASHVADAAQGRNPYNIPGSDLGIGRRTVSTQALTGLFNAPILGGVNRIEAAGEHSIPLPDSQS